MKGFNPIDTSWRVNVINIEQKEFGNEEIWDFKLMPDAVGRGTMSNRANIWTGEWRMDPVFTPRTVIENIVGFIAGLFRGDVRAAASGGKRFPTSSRFFHCKIKARDNSFEDEFSVAFVTDRYFVATQNGEIFRIGFILTS